MRTNLDLIHEQYAAGAGTVRTQAAQAQTANAREHKLGATARSFAVLEHIAGARVRRSMCSTSSLR